MHILAYKTVASTVFTQLKSSISYTPYQPVGKLKKNEQPRVEISSYVIVTLKWRDHVMSHLIVLRNFVEMGGAYLKYYNALTFDFASES